MNANDAALTRLSTAQTGSTVGDISPNAQIVAIIQSDLFVLV